jgi:hypothetical protein
MQFSLEGKTGILLALVGLAGGGAIMIAPEKLWIGWGLITTAAIGGVALGFHHFGRRFAFIFVVLGVLWFDSWYFSNVLNAPVAVQSVLQIIPTPVPSPSLAKPKLASTMARVILLCDSPKPEKPPSLAKRKAELAERIDVMQKIFGYSVTGDVTDNELTLSATFNTGTGAMKQDWLAKRTGDKIYVSIKTEMGPNNPMILFWALGSLAPLDPEEDFAKQTKEKAEQFLKVEPGKCKLI